MGMELDSKRGVKNHYGPRGRKEGIVGSLKTEGGVKQALVEFTGQNILDDVIGAIIKESLPAKSKIVRAIVKVDEAFVLTGTTPAIEVGTDGSEVTNGFTISEAQAEAVGTYVFAESDMQGTWAAELAASTRVGVALSGTSPVVTGAGKARVMIEYVEVEA